MAKPLRKLPLPDTSKLYCGLLLLIPNLDDIIPVPNTCNCPLGVVVPIPILVPLSKIIPLVKLLVEFHLDTYPLVPIPVTGLVSNVCSPVVLIVKLLAVSL